MDFSKSVNHTFCILFEYFCYISFSPYAQWRRVQDMQMPQMNAPKLKYERFPKSDPDLTTEYYFAAPTFLQVKQQYFNNT